MVNSEGLDVLDFTDPSTPQSLGTYADGEYYYSVFNSGGYVYLGGTNTFRVLNASTPSAITNAGSVYLPDDALYDIKVSGGYAYAVDGWGNMAVFDVSTPTAPVVSATYDIGYESGALRLSGGYAYLTAGQSTGLVEIDISDPLSPVASRFFDTPFYAGRLDIDNTTAYVADLIGGLRMIDISQ